MHAPPGTPRFVIFNRTGRRGERNGETARFGTRSECVRAMKRAENTAFAAHGAGGPGVSLIHVHGARSLAITSRTPAILCLRFRPGFARKLHCLRSVSIGRNPPAFTTAPTGAAGLASRGGVSARPMRGGRRHAGRRRACSPPVLTPRAVDALPGGELLDASRDSNREHARSHEAPRARRAEPRRAA
jgi:hypothetical protein